MTNEEGIDFSYQVMVYNSTKEVYEKLMASLPEIFKDIKSDDEYWTQEILENLEKECQKYFFKEAFAKFANAENIIKSETNQRHKKGLHPCNPEYRKR